MSDTGRPRRERPIHLVTTARVGIGRGHLSRTLTLAETLVDDDGRVSLELTAGRLTGEAAARAERMSLDVTAVAAPDAVVVIDLPNLDDAPARAPAERLVVFDDRDAFGGEAALVIQPSMPAWAGSGSAGSVLAGFAYAPVARSYVELREQKHPTGSSGALEVVVCFGGSDPALVTARIAPALAAAGEWRTATVVGADYADEIDKLGPLAVRDPVDLPARLARADLAVIGAGTMKFELACLGRPSVLLAVADDQLVAGPQFASTGAADYLGDGRTIEPELVVESVRSLVEDHERRLAMAGTATEVVDGLGAERIAAAILTLAGRAPR